MGSHTANNKSSYMCVSVCVCVWLLIIKCLIKHSCRTAPSIMLYMSHSGICPSQHWNGPKTLWKWFKIFLLTAAQNVFLLSQPLLLPSSNSHTHTRRRRRSRKRSVRLLIIKQSLKRNSISVIRNETLRTQHWTGQQTNQAPPFAAPSPSPHLPPTLWLLSLVIWQNI